MPQASLRISPALGISLDHPWFTPGQHITGHVYRKTPIVSPDAKLLVKCAGRAKTKVSKTDEQKTALHRTRYQFWQGWQDPLHDGPLHVFDEQSAKEWPIMLRLPHGVPRDVLVSWPDLPYCYIRHEPGRFDTDLPMSVSLGINKSVEVFVEYWLEATLRATVQGKQVEFRAIHPVTVRHIREDPPIVDFRLQLRLARGLAKSHRLLPGMENAALSASQRMKKMFGSSSVPSFAFTLQVEAPTVVQFENPSHFPFRMKIIPDPQFTSSAIRDVSVQLTSLDLSITSHTETKYIEHKGIVATACIDTDHDFWSYMTKPGREVFLPVGQEDDSLDVGEKLGARFQMTLSNDKRWLMYPSHTTYHMEHRHRLKWSIQINIAGEVSRIKGHHCVVIWPASVAGHHHLRRTLSNGWVTSDDLEAIAEDVEEELPTFEESQRQTARSEERADTGPDGRNEEE